MKTDLVEIRQSMIRNSKNRGLPLSARFDNDLTKIEAEIDDFVRSHDEKV